MTKIASVCHYFKRKITVGETVTVRGWIRTRQSSKQDYLS